MTLTTSPEGKLQNTPAAEKTTPSAFQPPEPLLTFMKTPSRRPSPLDLNRADSKRQESRHFQPIIFSPIVLQIGDIYGFNGFRHNEGSPFQPPKKKPG